MRIMATAATQQQALTVAQAIETRNSIRKYKPEPIPEADLNEILRQASLAPSAWNVQPWRFHVVTDPALKEKLKEAAYGQAQVTSAPAVIMVASDMEDMLAHPYEATHPGMPQESKDRMVKTIKDAFEGQSVEERAKWGLTQTNIALGFLMLAARGMGYATVPMLGFDEKKVQELLGLPAHVKFAAMLPIGLPAEEGYPHHRHSLERIVVRH